MNTGGIVSTVGLYQRGFSSVPSISIHFGCSLELFPIPIRRQRDTDGIAEIGVRRVVDEVDLKS